MSDNHMKPMLILSEGTMSPENIQRLIDNGICVVEAKDPAAIKFVDPMPAISSRSQIEQAAIELSRIVLSKKLRPPMMSYEECLRFFTEALVEGTRLDANPRREEIEEGIFTEAKRHEIARLAQQEAREERAAIRAAKAEARKAKQAGTKKEEPKAND